jgi:putative addiction module component (TIGR02574 family)
MSKAEILDELPKLKQDELQEILDRICELEDAKLLQGATPTASEKALLDRELEEYQRNPEAGSTWEEVKARVRSSK